MSHLTRCVAGPRLTLVATTLAHLEAELDGGPLALGRLLQARVPASWPPGEYDRDALLFFRDRLMADGPTAVGWYGWYAVADAHGPTATLVGAGGYFGPPDADGTVEIGYSIAPEHQRSGYATELVECLVAHAWDTGMVRTLCAQTTPANVASVRVLARTGFAAVGAGREPGSVRFEHRGRPA